MKYIQRSNERSGRIFGSLEGITRQILAMGCGCLIAGNCSLLHAQSDTGPAEITYGPFSFEPLVDAELSYDDNIFRSAADEVDSWVMRIKPTLNAAIEADGQSYTLTYDGNYGFYENSGDDDYDDHRFLADADLNLDYRNQVNVSASYMMGHEDRGTGITEGIDSSNPIVDTPIRLDTTNFDAEYAFGSEGSTNRIVLAGGYQDIQYQNHLDLTRYLSWNGARAGATYYYRVRPATSLLAEIVVNTVNYDLTRPGTPSFDSNTYRYRVGGTWEVTEKTSGTVKLGRVDRKFDDEVREDFSDFDWDVTIRWSPRSYSHIELVTARPSKESYGFADFIDTELYAAAWTHEWTERLESRLGVAYQKEIFEGSVRAQETLEYDLALTHQWRRWLSFELGAAFSERDSTIDRLIFERTIFWLSASFSL
jgi:hypothetical protein